jgi:preprotein translocase subunit SecG
MESYLVFSQIFVSLLLIATVLLQVRGLGSGLFGSAESTFRTRRGVEKTLFQLTIVLGVVFVIVSIVGFELS